MCFDYLHFNWWILVVHKHDVRLVNAISLSMVWQHHTPIKNVLSRVPRNSSSIIGTLQKQTNRKRLISSRCKNSNGSKVPKGTELQFFKKKTRHRRTKFDVWAICFKCVEQNRYNRFVFQVLLYDKIQSHSDSMTSLRRLQNCISCFPYIISSPT